MTLSNSNSSIRIGKDISEPFDFIIQLLAYADNIDIIGRTKRGAVSAIEWESTKMSLTVNKGKTKYILLTSMCAAY